MKPIKNNYAMVKKLLTLALGLLCIGGLQAQTEGTIAAADVVNWTGNGSQQAVLIVEFDTVAYAWGYRFDAADAPTALNMITAIDAADPRLAYSMDWTTYEFNFYYVAWPEKHIAANYRFKVNGTLADDGDEFSDYDLENGMVVKVSAAAGTVWSQPVRAASTVAMPQNSTIAAERIRYWVGSGENQAVVVVNWGEPDTALAWGVRYTGDLTIGEALLKVASADPRLTVSSTIDAIDWADGASTWHFHPAPASYVQFILNDNSNVNAGTAVAPGDMVKVGESAFGTGIDSTEYSGAWYPMSVVWSAPVQPVPHPDAEIAADDILYWVGSGSHSVVMAINWADTALAWGYRFSEDTVTVQEVMDSIAAADPRFSYTIDYGYLTDIRFGLNATDTLGITPGSYFESTRNHVSDAGLYQKLVDGDFEKWADPAAGTLVDSMSYDYGGQTYWMYIYVYRMPVSPVSAPVPAGIGGVHISSMSVWPNPAVQTVVVSFGAALSATEAAVYDLTGRKVASQAVAAGSESVALPVGQLPQGTYLLRVGSAAAKLVVKH